MRVVLKRGDAEHDMRVPHEGADHALVDIDCPLCGATAPLGVQGKRMRIADDDRAYESDGFTTCCKAPVGTIRAEMSTLFGLHEDEAVLVHGRPRVY